jgi:hypothetical protein
VCCLTLTFAAVSPSVASAGEAAAVRRGQSSTLDRAATSFGSFCVEWMQRLAKRNEHNIKGIKWKQDESGVRGAYVSYSPDHVCAMSEHSRSAPTGKITYQEVRYEKRGATIAEANRSVPRPIEIFEVTEIFTFRNGRWEF